MPGWCCSAATGPVNKFLVSIGVLSEPVQLLFHRGTVLLGMTAVLLPLMVLTIYSSVSRLDPGLTRAALASGAGPIAVFWRVLLPLTLPGIGAGFLLVFVAAIGFFITPTLLGGPGDQMFAMHITQQADSVTSEGFLQALGVVLLLITLAVVAIAGRFLGLEFIWGGRKLTESAATQAAPAVTSGAPRRSFGSKFADIIGWPLLRLFGMLPASCGTWTVRLMGGLVVAVLILPIVVVMIISFSSASYLTFPPPGFSLRWYEQFFSDTNWMRAFWTSALIATVSACDRGRSRHMRRARHRPRRCARQIRDHAAAGQPDHRAAGRARPVALHAVPEVRSGRLGIRPGGGACHRWIADRGGDPGGGAAKRGQAA